MADFKRYPENKFHLPRRYKLIKELGAGSYGTVCSVVDTKFKDRSVHLAVKKVGKVFDNPILMKRAIRELKLMRFLRGHRNDSYAGLYCFQELMDWDLTHVLYSPMQFSEFHIQSFFYQILQGIKYTHSANIIHRDLKPGNILVNRHGTLKLADFGLARGITTIPAAASPITNYVATRWYRAPELLAKVTKYGKEVDMWAAGVILGEMYGRRPMMPGKDSMGQIIHILDVLGEPPAALVKKRGWKLPSTMGVWKMRNNKPISHRWSELYPFASTSGLQLVGMLLQWDPSARLTVEEALEHHFLGPVRNQNGEASAPGIFEFSAEEERLDHQDLFGLLTKEVREFQKERKPKIVSDAKSVAKHVSGRV
ncbi:hypothetical protein FT663_04019 [Candidozyma haemuli var. vulneris]|nr:hypothetical protein FT662_04099 [[Candida] haemuloni var. vulneris]KAF3988481.1 hypothetical protein FT663_04019 [[Candida] haemuloni var. vulneris]